MGVQISEVKRRPKLEHFSLDFGRRSNTEPTDYETKVKGPRTELVQISDVHCATEMLRFWSVQFIALRKQVFFM